MAVRLNRWGHSLGLRIPAFVAKACGLVVGDYVFIRINHETGEIIMVPASAREVDPRYFSSPEPASNEIPNASNAQDSPADAGVVRGKTVLQRKVIGAPPAPEKW